MSFSLTQVGLGTLVVPFLLGVVYVLFGMGILPMGKILKIVLVYSALPLISILMFALDSHIQSIVWSERDSFGNPIHLIKASFWFNSGGVCTEGTICWIWGQFVPAIVSIISVVIGVVCLAKAKRFSATQ